MMESENDKWHHNTFCQLLHGLLFDAAECTASQCDVLPHLQRSSFQVLLTELLTFTCAFNFIICHLVML